MEGLLTESLSSPAPHVGTAFWRQLPSSILQEAQTSTGDLGAGEEGYERLSRQPRPAGWEEALF